MLDAADHIEPDLSPEPVALRARPPVAHVDGHLKVPRLLAYDGRVDAPEGVEVVVDLVEEILDDDGVMLLGEFVPLTKARRRVTAAPLAVRVRSRIDARRLLLEECLEGRFALLDERVDRV